MTYIKTLILTFAATLVASEPPVQGYDAPYNYHAANAVNAAFASSSPSHHSANSPSNSYLPPNPGYNNPSIGYNNPSNGYNNPSNGYNNPSNGYNNPSNGHNNPSNGYNNPSNGYNSPSNGYNNPSNGYNNPSNEYNNPSTEYGAPNVGHHDSYDGHGDGHGHDNEVPKSYEFGYSVKDAQSGNDYGRQETSDGNTVRGEYRVMLPDGRTQIVTYHADWQTGFHADVRYEGEARYPEPQSHQQNLIMYPTKSILDYMQEMDRLFPQSTENDIPDIQPNFGSSLNYQSPFFTPSANHSSSSADSMSPDTFLDMTFRQFDTPQIPRRQRPIVGRKILGNTEQPRRPYLEQPISSGFDFDLSHLDQFTRYGEEAKNVFVEQNYSQSYELFPKNNIGFSTPMKISPIGPNLTQNLTNASSFFNYPPIKAEETSARPHLPNMPRFGSKLDTGAPQLRSNYQPSTSHSYSRLDISNSSKMCTFCRKNGETPVVYMDHNVRGKVGNRNVVTCPILRSHVCSTCGASGDDAHTITYCPVLRRTNNGLPLQSTTITLKNTRIKSNGRRRY